MPGIFSKIGTTLEMIKWEHSIFALPFALTAVLLAAGGLPTGRTVAMVLVAMVAARSCAMAFNRWADADLDAANPRTSARAIPAGLSRASSCLDSPSSWRWYLSRPRPDSTGSRCISRRWF